MRFLFLGAPAAAILLALAPGCSERKSGGLEAVVLARSTTPHAGLVHVAAARGFFEEEGVAVTLQDHLVGKTALGSLLQGKADFATVADTPIVFAAAEGKRFAILAQIFASERDVAVVARKDRGITVAGDLRGKKVGVLPGTSSHYFLAAFLSANDLVEADVTQIPLAPDKIVEALQSGEADAISAWNPYLARTQRLMGERVVTFFSEEAYTVPFVLVGRQEFADRRAAVSRKLLRALLRAEEYVRDHPAESLDFIAGASGMDAALLRVPWRSYRYRVTLSQALIESLKEQSRWAMKNGLVPQAQLPPYHDFFPLAVLKSVKPEAVSVIE